MMALENIYLVKGYHVEKLVDNSMIFFHVPKAGGTTVANILSVLFDSSVRIHGLVTRPSEKLQNNYEYRLDVNRKQYSHKHSALDQFYERKLQIDLTSQKFIYGHFPYEMTYDLSDIDNRIKMTVLREPIKRCQSHINYFITKGFIKPPVDILSIFRDEIIVNDLMTRQFCGKSSIDELQSEHVDAAIDNIKKFDFVFEVNQIQHLLNMVISIYGFPNILYQNFNITENLNRKVKKYNFTDKDNRIIQEYNQNDINLYRRVQEEKLFFQSPIQNRMRDKNQTLIVSNDLSPVAEIVDNDRLKFYLDKIKEFDRTLVFI